ncbi:AAA family ATPase, putative [Plasmodium ovale]|uniref:AAA family ATPase, putative n=1 Tax=Plasmodium ovale TaxID=36330 RepID=A0A1D3KXF2_PLAOA|nr:AAA family ATPase, putative [Plasmodium ovale]
MKGISGVTTKETIYIQLREEEKGCFQDIILSEIWEAYGSSDGEEEGECKGCGVELRNFSFSHALSNIFENYEEDETYNEVINRLKSTETDNVDNKILHNDNYVSGISNIDIKNFMNFNPLFVKIYHEQSGMNKTSHDDEKSVPILKKNDNSTYEEQDGKKNGKKVKDKITPDQFRQSKTSFSEESDDEIYTPKALKLKKKKKNHFSDDNENESTVSQKKDKKKNYLSDNVEQGEPSPISVKKKDAFSNAFDVLVKRKNEKNEEAIKAFNSINLKKRSRNVSRYGVDRNGDYYCEGGSGATSAAVGGSGSGHYKREERRKANRKNRDNSKDKCEDIPEEYLHLIDEGLDVNVVRYALSMKMNANEQVKESDIIGLYDIKKIIKDKIVNVILRPDLFTGLNRAAKGILLFGPPGTGKTMIAKWVASSCNCSFYNVNTSSLFSKYIGETEKIVTSLFKCAEVDNPSILFFDEIDSLLGMRKKDEDDTTIRIKNQLLQMIDGINTKKDVIIVIIGATNRPDMIDDAALRRFNKRVYIPLPDLQARKEQIRYIISKHTHSGFQLTEQELDIISHKLENWNGSDIYHLCSKCYEYVYDDAVEQYNGIQNIPNTSIFRAIKYEDFIKAMEQVNTSYKNVFDYGEWSKMHSSL